MNALRCLTIAGFTALCPLLLAAPAGAQTATAVLKNAQGKEVGSANLTQTARGVLINLSVKGLPPGEHAFHIHAVGKCEPPFTSAGGVTCPTCMSRRAAT
jgi:Cu-Zn family superoxide dismutase